MRIFLLFFLSLPFLSNGQEYFANTREIGVEEGLSHYKVTSLYPEKEGMWIGTEDGLNFYDGYHWRYWTKADGNLRRQTVNFIQKDQDGLLWLFNSRRFDDKETTQFIEILNTKRDSSFSFEQKFGNQAPFAVADLQNFFEDQQQQLYFFANAQLWKYTPSSLFELVQLPTGFIPNSIFSDGSFAGKLKNKLALVSSTGELSYHSNYSLNDNPYTILGTAQKFWIHQYEAPSHVFERGPSSYKSRLAPVQPTNGQLKFLLCFDEQQGHTWVNSPSGIQLFDSQEQVLLQSDQAAEVAHIDHKGNLWSGKFELVLLHLQKKKFKRYLYQNQKGKTIKDFYHCRGLLEKNGKLFVNTYKGLRLVDLETAAVITPSMDLGLNFAFYQDQEQRIWVARKKVFQLNDTDSQITKTYASAVANSRVWCLFKDQEDKMWVGGVGLYYLADGAIKKFEQYNDFEELAGAIILSIYKDKNGVIWVASDRGLYQLDLKKGILAGYGKNRKAAFHLPANKFQHLYQDAQGIFWLATADAGLLRWNKATGDLQQFDKSQGMPSNNLYAVYEDDYGYLWLSSFNGIIRFQKETQSISIYTEEDGISENEFNRISHYQTAKGTIYFGGQNGVTGFHPKDFLQEKSKQKAFNLRVEHTSIYGGMIQKDVLPNGKKIDLMDLAPGIRVIDFEVVGSDLFWTDKISLHYTLTPIGDYPDQVPAFKEKISSDNHIELFGMHPGTYQLQIKAILTNGKQLGETLELSLKIKKPIYHTAGFWVFAVITIGFCFWGFMKLRTARLRRRQAELETQVTERTNQIIKDQKIIQNQAFQIEAMKDQLNRKEELWLEQFQAIVKDRLEDVDLGLPEIIEKLEMSRSTFYEKVRALTNMTPNQYIQELRLNKAKVILDAGEVKTVKEVAYAVGMKRPSYFSKLYKERFGITPSAYFRKHRSG